MAVLRNLWLQGYGGPPSRRQHVTWPCLLLLVLGITGLITPAARAENPESAQTSSADLAEWTLEDLMNLEVTSVSKKKEQRREAAAAVYVITAEDIRRSDASSLPELLRRVPGLYVARLDANKWAITARGFNGRFANKLLVLVDGRSIYTPLFSGVLWEQQDVVLENIERIEIVRGTGGTLWGANAANGVINITTKQARDTQGGLLSLMHGTDADVVGVMRYGARITEDAHYRLSLKYADRNESDFPSGAEAHDFWETHSLSFRVDLAPAPQDAAVVEGALYDVDQGSTFDLAYPYLPFSRSVDALSENKGGHLLLRWQREFPDGSEMSVQAYYDRAVQGDFSLYELRSVYDMEFQYRLAVGERHDIVCGSGFRYSEDCLTDSYWIGIEPERRCDRLYNVFLQDEMSFLDNRLRLTLGTKFEYNDYSGFEFQPSVHAAWVPGEKHSIWASVSRAIRTPSQIEQQGSLSAFALPPILVRLTGTAQYDSEDLLAFEAGYRATLSEHLTLDLAFFYNRYDGLRAFTLGWPAPKARPFPPHLLLPLYTTNNSLGRTCGAEVAADWQLRRWWCLRTSYSYLRVKVITTGGLVNLFAEDAEEDTPRHQASVHSRMDLPRNVELDVYLGYVGKLRTLQIDSYVDLDVRLGWRPREDLELAVAGQNLLESQRSEFTSVFVDTLPADVARAFYGKVTWRF